MWLWYAIGMLGHIVGRMAAVMRHKKRVPVYAIMDGMADKIITLLHQYSTTVRTERRMSNKRRVRGRPRRKGRTLTCSAVMVFAAAAKSTPSTTFDTDSGQVGIDNRASGCFSHVIEDFVGPMRECNKVVKGFGGSRTSNVKMGTLKWSWDDDNGIRTTHMIPNSYYSKDGGVRLLSPQHFAQTTPVANERTGSRTTARSVVLMWGKNSTKTVPLDRRNNVATFYLSAGYNAYSTFCMQAGVTEDQDEIPMTEDWPEEHIDDRDVPCVTGSNKTWTSIKEYDFNNGRRVFRPSSMEINKLNMEAELLQIHYDMGHIHPDRLKLMSKQGVIPPKYGRVKMPFCAACAHGKATRRPWRSRSTNNKDEAWKPTKPGEVVSVDQLISPTPGLIAQMSGMLTSKRYTCATVYVDHFSGYSFVWIQRTTSAEETLVGKRAFEEYARASGVKVSHYHADNGVFKARAWVEDCNSKHQRVTYAGVGAHHQNGVAERRIRVLQDLTRAQLAHASYRWPEAVSANLWPYAMRIANDEWNQAPNPREKTNRSPAQLFHRTDVQRNSRHSVPFGSPTYVLRDELQQRVPFHKWKDRARLGMYLGRSPLHPNNISLVMDIEKGYVSPQFHCTHDKAFSTVRNVKDGNHGKWKIRAGFVRQQRRKAMQDGYPQRRPDEREQGSEPSSELNKEGSMNPHGNDPEEGNQTNETISHTTTVDERCVQEAEEGPELLAYTSVVEEGPQELQAMKAQADPDTMYYHQAMKEPDADKFLEAMDKEIQDQCKNGNFDVVLKTEIPQGTKLLPAVWQMRRKRDIRTGVIKKYKARLNLDGSKMIKGIDYDRTYAPVATWNATQ